MLDTSTFVTSTRQKFGNSLLNVEIKNDRRVTMDIEPSALLSVSNFLYSYLNFRFIIASALHTRLGFEIYYHFSSDPGGLVLNLHVVLPHDNPKIESLANTFEGANWIEREMHELFGIDFLNHPNLEPLISEGNWALGVYPYRKDPKELKME